jgi:hypothetical protein
MDIRKHLVLSRNGLAEIETLTKNLGNEPSLEDIESVVRKRDTLVTRMKHGEHQLSVQDPLWSKRIDSDPFLKSLFDESKALLGTVADIDSRLASLIESRMAAVKRQLSSLYTSSRAAYSYTSHSSLGATR